MPGHWGPVPRIAGRGLSRCLEPKPAGGGQAVAPAYVEAGSRIILTNTFGANRFNPAGINLATAVAEINAAGVGILRGPRAAGRESSPRWVPAALTLMMGEVSEDDAGRFSRAGHRNSRAGADGIVSGHDRSGRGPPGRGRRQRNWLARGGHQPSISALGWTAL